VTITVTAVYEGGVLKLEKPIDLKEKSKVHLIIEADPEAQLPADGNDPTGWKEIDALRGIVKDAPADMAANHDKYLYGAMGE
jgi:hypothetical protein